jgi:hypothetical protein
MSDEFDALYDRIMLAEDANWQTPSKFLRSSSPYTPPTFDLVRVAEDWNHSHPCKAPIYEHHFGIKIVLGPSNDALTYRDAIRDALLWDRERGDNGQVQYWTNLGGLVRYARIQGVEYYRTECAEMHELVLTIAARAAE